MATKSTDAPSRRKTKKRFVTFTLVVEAQEMIVQYEANRMADYGQFEFRSPHEPPRRIPVSETGYRSHFAPLDEVAAAASPQEYARDLVLAMLQSPRSMKTDRNQLSMF